MVVRRRYSVTIAAPSFEVIPNEVRNLVVVLENEIPHFVRNDP